MAHTMRIPSSSVRSLDVRPVDDLSMVPLGTPL